MRDKLLVELTETASRPMEQAYGLSPQLYRDPDILELEQSRIFAEEWQCAGLAADIPKTGDYLTYSLGDDPIMVMRQKDGSIAAHANVCRHRMMQLVEGRGNTKRLVCPYHAWTYDLDGRLIGAPHMQDNACFKKKQLSLKPVRVEIWHGWIYVTANPDASPVGEQLALLDPVVNRYRMADYIPVAHEDHRWQTNWKLLTENFMEGYHLPVAHKSTVGAWMPVDEIRFPEERYDHFTWQSFPKDEDATYGRAHPDNTHLEGKWRYTSVMPTVFPCHMYVLAPDHLWYLSLRPAGTGEVLVRFGAAIAPEVYHALENREEWIKTLQGFFDMVNDEDRFVVEGIYAGSGSSMSEPGPLSHLEREIHDFQHYLARKLVHERS